MLDAVCDCLNKLKVKYIRIDGSTRKQERGVLINIFQEKSICQVAVLSLGACNSGITLTAAELIIFAELSWNPSVSIWFFLCYLNKITFQTNIYNFTVL